jgi:hypothetical protein
MQLIEKFKSITSIKKAIIIGIALGVVFAVINSFFLFGFGVQIFEYILPFVLSIAYINLFPCSGEGCWGSMILMGDILFLIVTPLFIVFVTYLIDIKNHPYNFKKITIVALVIIFVILANNLYTFDQQARKYASKLHFVHSGQDYITRDYTDLSSVKECKGELGSCYGYFASLTNDVKKCNEYLENYPADKQYTIAECITAYAVIKNDISDCSNIQDKQLRGKCEAQYYMVKEEYNCEQVEDNSWRSECTSHFFYLNEDPKVRRYAEYRGYTK